MAHFLFLHLEKNLVQHQLLKNNSCGSGATFKLLKYMETNCVRTLVLIWALGLQHSPPSTHGNTILGCECPWHINAHGYTFNLKTVRGVKRLSYHELLKKIDLCTLEFTRMRGELIETYKLPRGHVRFELEILPLVVESQRKCHSYKNRDGH